MLSNAVEKLTIVDSNSCSLYGIWCWRTLIDQFKWTTQNMFSNLSMMYESSVQSLEYVHLLMYWCYDIHFWRAIRFLGTHFNQHGLGITLFAAIPISITCVDWMDSNKNGSSSSVWCLVSAFYWVRNNKVGAIW